MSDIRVDRYSSVLRLVSLTEPSPAQSWVDENMRSQPWPCLDAALAVGPRCVGDRVDAAIPHRLEVDAS
jgi:hypothetical protein